MGLSYQIQARLKYKLPDVQKTKKDVVLKFRSVNNMVIAPANTGNDNNNKNAVINTAQTIRGNLCMVIPGDRILKIVVIKLIAPMIEDAPAKCNEKIAKSTEGP